VSLLDEVVNTLTAQMDRCDGTPAEGQVSAIASQASRLSDFNAQIATKIGSAFFTTAAPTITSTPDVGPSSILKTSTSSSLPSNTSVPGPAAVITSPTSETTEAPSTTTSGTVGPGPKLSQSWIAGPVIGSILGMATVFVVIYCTRRKHNREEGWELGNIKEVSEEDQESTRPPPADEDAGKAMLHSQSVEPKEMENTEIIAPVELPALEPVGMELLTPRSATDNREKDWPLPVSPLPALFAMTEIRDERTGADSPKHNTFYHA
jgi:hypothetical protein